MVPPEDGEDCCALLRAAPPDIGKLRVLLPRPPLSLIREGTDTALRTQRLALCGDALPELECKPLRPERLATVIDRESSLQNAAMSGKWVMRGGTEPDEHSWALMHADDKYASRQLSKWDADATTCHVLHILPRLVSCACKAADSAVLH